MPNIHKTIKKIKAIILNGLPIKLGRIKEANCMAAEDKYIPKDCLKWKVAKFSRSPELL